MTLHEAIIKILMNANAPMSSRAIADAINELKLYIRRDGQKLSATQITARAGNYPKLLKIDNSGNIEIVNRALHSFRITYFHILNRFRKSQLLSHDIRFIAACTIYVSWLSPDRLLMRHNPEKVDFIQFFHEMTATLHPKEAMRRYMTLLEQLTAFELHEIQQYIYTPASADKVDTKTFGAFFNDIINEYNSDDNWRSGESSTPTIISKFISSFYKVNGNGKIFDPFVGCGGTLVQTYRFNYNRDPKIVAGDINVPSLQLAEMNALANGCGREYFYHKNAFTDWSSSIDADLIVSVPPLGIKIPSYDLHNRFPQLENILVELGIAFTNVNIESSIASVLITLAHLNTTGKGIVVVPNSFLSSIKNDALNLKQLLLFSNWLEGVISLPDGAFRPLHSVSCSILLINKQANFSKKEVFLCDASKNTLDTFGEMFPSIVNAFHNKVEIENVTRLITLEEAVNSDLNLDPKRHLARQLSGKDLLTVAQLASALYSGAGVPKHNLNRTSGIPYLQVGDLIESNGLNEIDLSKASYFISDDEQLSKNPKFIPNRAVLITKIGTKLKASLYNKLGDAICNPNIIVVKADESIVLPEYLITQFQSEYVLEQVDTIRKGTGLPHFSQDDFQHIKIKVPSLAEQQVFVTSFYGKKLTESETVTEQKQEDDYYNIIANLKHELKQPVSSLGMDLTILEEFLDRKVKDGSNIQWDEPLIELLPGESANNTKSGQLKVVLARIQSSIANAANTLTKAEEILNIGKGAYHPEKIGFKQFLASVIAPVFSNENCTINILGNEQEVFADKYQMEVLFKRIIENAIKHGFKKGTDKTSNIINITLAGKTAKKEFNEIIVENNGTPLPDGFDINKLQKSGHTTNRRGGTGFGGFHIKRIIESHKGEIYIADKRETEATQFKVKFKIYIP